MENQPKPSLEGKVIVVDGTKKAFSRIQKLFNQDNGIVVEHFKTIQEAVEAHDKNKDVNLLLIDYDILKNSSIDWLKTSFGNILEIMILNKNGPDGIGQQELIQRGREGAFGILNHTDLELSELDVVMSKNIYDKSLEAMALSVRKQRSPIKSWSVDTHDQIFLRNVLSGVDIFSSRFWTPERCREYSGSLPPRELKIVGCDSLEGAIRTFSYSQHRKVLLKSDQGNELSPAFHIKVFPNPTEKAGAREYIAPAMYEADLELAAAEKINFPIVQYEGFSRTESGLFYILKHRKVATIDYYFLLYTPKIRDLRRQQVFLESTFDKIYHKLIESLGQGVVDVDELVKLMRETAGEYSPVLDVKTLRAGVSQFVQLHSSGAKVPTLEDLKDLENPDQNKIFAQLNEVRRELVSNIHNYESARNSLIEEALYAIAENDARWTANRAKIAEFFRKLTGNEKAKISNDDSYDYNKKRLGRYLENIFLFRSQQDLRKGPTYETDKSAISSFRLFSDRVITSVSKSDFNKVSKMFADLLGQKELYVFTQGDMRLQHIFYDKVNGGPEIFDYGRAKEERRGISAIEFLIDHTLDLNCAQIERFMSIYYNKFISRYEHYCSRLNIVPNPALLVEHDRQRKKNKEIRACFLLGILYRFRKMGPFARDSIMYNDHIKFPKWRINYPHPVETFSNGTRRTLDQTTTEEVDPNSFKDQNNYYAPDFIVDYHINSIREILHGAIEEPERRYLSKKDVEALKALDTMLSSHEICIETQGQVIKKRVSLYDKRCEPYQEG